MKKAIFCLGVLITSNLTISQIYTTDGTISANRTVTTSSRFINFVPVASSPTNNNIFFSGSGNIGLGTTSPTSRLNIANGDVSLTSSTANSGRLLIGTTISNSSYNWGIKSSKPFIIESSSFPLITLSAVSIGCISSGDFAIATNDGNFSTFAKKGDLIIRTNTGTPCVGNLILADENEGNIKFVTGKTGVNSMVQLLIDKTGTVGIGTGEATLNPSEKLAVNGLIHTKEVRVDLIGWPDFVFNDDYELMPLSTLEKKIESLGHLPEIPSAKEVEEKGVLVGEMNKKLLQKVEELTLYVIQLNKEIDALKNKN